MIALLIEALHSLGLRPGERISLKDLCDYTGLSKVAVRELVHSGSLRALVRDELIDHGFDLETIQRGRKLTYSFKKLNR